MAKIKCKTCCRKLKVSSLARACNEISCSLPNCPIICEGKNKIAANMPDFQQHTRSFSPRMEKLLEFDDDFDTTPVAVVSSFESPEPSKIITDITNSDEFKHWC